MNIHPAKTVEECAEQCLGCFESFVMAGIKEPERTDEINRLKSIIHQFVDRTKLLERIVHSLIVDRQYLLSAAMKDYILTEEEVAQILQQVAAEEKQ